MPRFEWTESSNSRNCSRGVVRLSNTAMPESTVEKSIGAKGLPKRPIRANVAGTGWMGSSCTIRNPKFFIMNGKCFCKSRNLPDGGMTV